MVDKVENVSNQSDTIDSLKAKLQKLQQETGTCDGHKVTYVGGFSFRFEKAQGLASSLLDPNLSPESKKSIEDLLQQETTVLSSKLDKVIHNITDIAQAMKGKNRGWNKVKVDQSSLGKKRVYLAHMEGSHLQIVSEQFINRLSKKLGKGSFGIVSGDQRLTHAAYSKKAYGTHLRKAIRDLHNEKNALTKIHENGVILGIVRPPKVVVTLSKDDVRLIGDKFDFDLDAMHDLAMIEGSVEKEKICKGFGHMFKALGNIHSRHMFHGDIKHANIGVFDSDKEDPLRLADWGGSYDLSGPNPKLSIQTYTSTYVPQVIGDALDDAIEENDQDRFEELLAKADYFALARSLVESLLPNLLTDTHRELLAQIFNDQPVLVDPDSNAYSTFPDLPIDSNLLEKNLKDAGYSPEIIDLLKSMFQACDPQLKTPPQLANEWGKKLHQFSSIDAQQESFQQEFDPIGDPFISQDHKMQEAIAEELRPLLSNTLPKHVVQELYKGEKLLT